MEAYRNRFEEAMIRIEDAEDVEAYKDAKAEIDDEFKEEAEALAGDPEAPEPVPEPVEEVENPKQLDKVSQELKRSEYVEWRDHPGLNQITKMAIGMHEAEFTFDKYNKEREEKEGTVAQLQDSDNE